MLTVRVDLQAARDVTCGEQREGVAEMRERVYKSDLLRLCVRAPPGQPGGSAERKWKDVSMVVHVPPNPITLSKVSAAMVISNVGSTG